MSWNWTTEVLFHVFLLSFSVHKFAVRCLLTPPLRPSQKHNKALEGIAQLHQTKGHVDVTAAV